MNIHAMNADAEIVRLKCEKCGHQWYVVLSAPSDRDEYVACPKCHAEYSEYGYIVEKRVALLKGTAIRREDGRVIDVLNV